MKWSEQMRELLSVDENFNQLELDMDKKILKLNGTFLVNVTGYSDGTHVVEYPDYKRIIKKYPFFKDKKFLLGCIFKSGEDTDCVCFSNTSVIQEYRDKFLIIAKFEEASLEIRKDY